MTPAKPAKCSVSPPPARFECRSVLVLWAVWVLAVGVQAAVSTTAEAPPSTPGTATRLLDKALGGDLSTGDRNLDLLLDAQRKGMDRLDDNPASRAVPDRPANGRRAIQPLPEPARPAETPMPLPPGNRSIAPLAMPGQVLQTAPSGTLPGPNRDWRGSAGPAAIDRIGANAEFSGEANGLRAVDSQLRVLILEGVAFVKERLIEILVAWGLIALLVAGVKAYSRRI